MQCSGCGKVSSLNGKGVNILDGFGDMFAKTNCKIHLWLLSKSKGDSIQKVGKRVPCENDNSKGTSSQRRKARVEVHV